MPDFDLLHGCRNNAAVFLQAFDLLELDGVDLRAQPLEERKATVEVQNAMTVAYTGQD